MAAVDLFGWRELKAAEAAVSAAHAVRAMAAFRVRIAPAGQISARRKALADATAAALRVELELAAVQREAGL